MKNTLRYIFAIPLGILVSMILPKWFMFIFNTFIPFDFINQFIENYLLTVFEGWVAVGVTVIIVPKRQILFGAIQVILNVIGAIYMYKLNNDFNYLFLIGGLVALYFSYGAQKEQKAKENKELANRIRKLKSDTGFKDTMSKLK
ncbi:hypothetical protein [Polaribacter atrinae]|uniref:hypothetical protein n=1 Tax=Polaribacter atrinae TaxID=1333662 RepID=UPI00249242D4|nr:hypothetical protein [Polaribacter atrinae]